MVEVHRATFNLYSNLLHVDPVPAAAAAPPSAPLPSAPPPPLPPATTAPPAGGEEVQMLVGMGYDPEVSEPEERPPAPAATHRRLTPPAEHAVGLPGLGSAGADPLSPIVFGRHRTTQRRTQAA